MSQPSSQTQFVPSSIDTRNERLVSGDRDISLTLKSYAVLKYLTEWAGQLVTKDELLNALWPQTFVSDAVFCLLIPHELRTLRSPIFQRMHLAHPVVKKSYEMVVANMPAQYFGGGTPKN